jgi:hypothetical protein
MESKDELVQLVLRMPQTSERLLQMDTGEIEKLLFSCKEGVKYLTSILKDDYEKIKPHIEIVSILKRFKENRKRLNELRAREKLYREFVDLETGTICTIDSELDETDFEPLGDETDYEGPAPPPTSPAKYTEQIKPFQATTPKKPSTPRRSISVPPPPPTLPSKLPQPRMRY